MTPTELRAFLEATRSLHPRWYTLTVLGFTLGMRPGELRPLRWDDDVDLDAGTLTIRRSQRRRYIGPTKTKRVRVISLPAALVDLLRAHREAMKGSAGFGQVVFPMKGAPGIAIGMKRLESLASVIGLPPRKLRGLRWDVDVDLATGVVRRSSGQDQETHHAEGDAPDGSGSIAPRGRERPRDPRSQRPQRYRDAGALQHGPRRGDEEVADGGRAARRPLVLQGEWRTVEFAIRLQPTLVLRGRSWSKAARPDTREGT
jgi:Phage integrase family